jgi:hypothetical protein
MNARAETLFARGRRHSSGRAWHKYGEDHEHRSVRFQFASIAALIRMSGGNFRLLTRLLTQVQRVLKVNQADIVSKEIVTAARDSLVIGQG